MPRMPGLLRVAEVFLISYYCMHRPPPHPLRGAFPQVNTLREVREKECNLDLELCPAEEKYAFLHKYKVQVSDEETELLDNIRYNWKKLKAQSVKVQDALSAIQVCIAALHTPHRPLAPLTWPREHRRAIRSRIHIRHVATPTRRHPTWPN